MEPARHGRQSPPPIPSSSTSPGAPWHWIEDFVYRDGLLLGSERATAQGGRRHYHLDHLGSPRLVTGANGSVISEHDMLPFGEERTTVGQHQARGYDREEPLRFTGHERDFDNAQPNDSSAYGITQENLFSGWTRGDQSRPRMANGLVSVDVRFSNGSKRVDVRTTFDPKTADVVSVIRTAVP